MVADKLQPSKKAYPPFLDRFKGTWIKIPQGPVAPAGFFLEAPGNHSETTRKGGLRIRLIKYIVAKTLKGPGTG
jgi:hypothetical protein